MQTRFGMWIALSTAGIFALISLGLISRWIPKIGTTGADDVPYVMRNVMLWSGINLVFGLLAAVIALVWRPHRPGIWPRVSLVFAAALLVSIPRYLVLFAMGLTPTSLGFRLLEWGAGLFVGLSIAGIALVVVSIMAHDRRQLALVREASARAGVAVADLQKEELRVRRQVYDRLHGPLQHEMVAVTFGMEAIAAQLMSSDPDSAALLRELSGRLDRLRERDVRALSHAMLPIGVDLGAFRAIESMLRRLPPSIATSFTIDPRLQQQADRNRDSLAMPARLVVVFAVEEALTNALKHGSASRIDVSCTLYDGRLRVTIDDDGPGLPAGEISYEGLKRHAERVMSKGGTLALGANPAGGARLRLEMPYQLDD